MIGMELEIPGAEIVEKCLEKGFVINCTHDTVLRFAPPLTVEKEEIDRLIQVLDEVLKRGDQMKRDLLTIRDLSDSGNPELSSAPKK